MRRPILTANWKLHKSRAEARAFAEAFLPMVSDARDVDIVLAPPFTALDQLAAALAGSRVELAAQDVSAETEGAFTGEISPGMLVDVGCSYAIVGHSERRTLYFESSEEVCRKAVALLAAGVRPIVCVGESLREREAGRTSEVVRRQLEQSLAEVPAADAERLVLAYEPIWAIGTGVTATPEQAQEVHAIVRKLLARQFGAAAELIRIQYGGSVKPDNIAALMAQPDIDGALVGGASLIPESFARIVHFERQEHVRS